MIDSEITIPTHDKLHLSAHIRIPDGDGPFPAVIICHDFLDNMKREFLVNLFLDLSFRRFIVLRFDFSHHGESHGERKETTITRQTEDITDVITYLETMSQVDKKKIAIVGHGLGGDIALLTDDFRIKAIVTIGSRCRLDEFLRSYFNEEEVHRWRQEKTINYEYLELDIDFLNDIQKYDVLESLKKKDIPMLFFHGQNDKRSPFENAREFYNHANQGTLEIVEDADHRFTDPAHREYLFETLGMWLEKTFT